MACESTLSPDDEAPALLSQTGLYADIATKEISAVARAFAPRFVLWSDAADKQRWVYVPECEMIDTEDVDEWSLPVGTRLWKEFTVGGARIETRLIERIGPGANDFIFATYLWDSAETDATLVLDGVVDALGTTHDVPAEPACRQCHGSHRRGGGRPARALGFSAVQLAGADGLSLEALAAEGKLSHPPSEVTFTVPGDSDEVRDALSYLHANCGSCHNASTDRVPQIDLDLALTFNDVDVSLTGAYRTAVGVPTTVFGLPLVTARVEPGNADASAVWFRMNERGNNAQMPPIGTETTDANGLAVVRQWVEGLP